MSKKCRCQGKSNHVKPEGDCDARTLLRFHRGFHGFQSLFFPAESFLLSTGKSVTTKRSIKSEDDSCGGGSCTGEGESLCLVDLTLEGKGAGRLTGEWEYDLFGGESPQTGIGRGGGGGGCFRILERITGEGIIALVGEGGEYDLSGDLSGDL